MKLSLARFFRTDTGCSSSRASLRQSTQCTGSSPVQVVLNHRAGFDRTVGSCKTVRELRVTRASNPKCNMALFYVILYAPNIFLYEPVHLLLQLLKSVRSPDCAIVTPEIKRAHISIDEANLIKLTKQLLGRLQAEILYYRVNPCQIDQGGCMGYAPPRLSPHSVRANF